MATVEEWEEHFGKAQEVKLKKTIVIKAIKLGDQKNSIMDSGQAWYSAFAKSKNNPGMEEAYLVINGLNEGMEVEVDYYASGNFNNLNGIVLVKDVNEDMKGERATLQTQPHDENTAMMRGAYFHGAVGRIVAGMLAQGFFDSVEQALDGISTVAGHIEALYTAPKQ